MHTPSQCHALISAPQPACEEKTALHTLQQRYPHLIDAQLLQADLGPYARQALLVAWQLHHEAATAKGEANLAREALTAANCRANEQQRRVSTAFTERADVHWAAFQGMKSVHESLAALLSLMVDLLPGKSAAHLSSVIGSHPASPVAQKGNEPPSEPLCPLVERCQTLLEAGLTVLSEAYDQRTADIGCKSPFRVVRQMRDVTVQFGPRWFDTTDNATQTHPLAPPSGSPKQITKIPCEGRQPQRPSRPEPASAPVDLTLQLELEGELDAVWRENHALRGFKFETEKQLVVVLRERMEHRREIERLGQQCEELARETDRMQSRLTAAYERKLGSCQRSLLRLKQELLQERQEKDELRSLVPTVLSAGQPHLHTGKLRVMEGRLAFVLNSRPFIVKAVWSAYNITQRLRDATAGSHLNPKAVAALKALEAELRTLVADFFTGDERRHLDIPGWVCGPPSAAAPSRASTPTHAVPRAPGTGTSTASSRSSSGGGKWALKRCPCPSPSPPLPQTTTRTPASDVSLRPSLHLGRVYNTPDHIRASQSLRSLEDDFASCV